MNNFITILGVFLMALMLFYKITFPLLETLYDITYSISPLLADTLRIMLNLSPLLFGILAYRLSGKILTENKESKKFLKENPRIFSDEKIQRDLKKLLRDSKYITNNNNNYTTVLEFTDIENTEISKPKVARKNISFLVSGIGNFYYEKDGKKYKDESLQKEGGIFQKKIKINMIYLLDKSNEVLPFDFENYS